MFGGTDFFKNLATEDNFLARTSRDLKMGLTLFWGQFACPFLPLTPKVTMCLADPIPVDKIVGDIPEEAIEELHERYLASIQHIFDKYKAAAGHPGAVLEIR